MNFTCQCGCGATPNIGKMFISGHNKGNRLPVDYIEQNRGFSSPCWIWQGALNNKGYGVRNQAKRVRLAHVLYYERLRGQVPEGRELDHLCRVSACVNPSHLEPVTHTTNMRRSKIIKLSMEIAREIRKAYAEAPRKFGMLTKLARQYNTHTSSIHLIVTNRIWREGV